MDTTDTTTRPHGPLQRLLRVLHDSPRRALVAVLFVIVAAGAIGGPVAGALDSSGGFAPPDADSARAYERLEDATGRQSSPGLVLLVDGTDAARLDIVADRLAAVPGVVEATLGGSAPDGSSSLVLGTIAAGVDDEAVAEETLDAFADDADVTVGGGSVIGFQIGSQVGEDLARAETLAFPVLALLALLVFGGRASLLPLAVGVATVLGTFLALTGVNQVYGLSIFALNLVIGLGLGLAIDYTLFLLTRYREELQRQGPTFAALATTMSTAGRTVAFSAATVAVALITLTVFPMGFLTSMGIAGATVAVVAALASLLITPLLLSIWGAKVARRRDDAGAAGRWHRLAHAVMRRPGTIAAATAAVMVLLALPALRVEWSPVDASVVPRDQSSRIVADTLTGSYGGTGSTPVTIALDGTARQADDLARTASALPGVVSPAEPREVAAGVWQLDLSVTGDPAGDAARDVVAQVRDVVAATDVDALVTGPAAEFIDQQQAIADGLPLAIALLVLLTLLVLWLMTGSVVLPVKAVVMNVLTVGVSLGALTWVYQDGRFTDLLGYTPNGGIEPTDFLVAAALVFALSTDYGVFLLGRIKEARESGLSEREAVATGLGRTGSVVTAAAILLAVAIGAFSTSEISFIQQIGIATAVGVLVDAFIVRSLLVPSLMGLMGKWNWWAPMWLRRVHDKVGLREDAAPAQVVVAPAGEPVAS